MIEYILQLLEQNNRVIIPELGAFVVKQRKPLLIVFNEFLQYNDGMLIDTLAKKENIDRNEAKVKIDQFVENIKNSLNKGELYPFEDLGVLMKSPTGKITLGEPNTVWSDGNIYLENDIALETEEPAIQDEKTDTQQTSNTEQPVETVSESVKPEQDKASESTTEREKPVKPRTPEPEPEKSEEKIKVQDSKHIVKEQKVEEKVEANVEIPKPYSITSETKVNHQPSSTKTRSVIVWTSLIVLANIIIVYLFINNSFSGLFKNDVEKLEPIIVTDSLEKTEIPSAPVIDTTPVIKETITVKSQTKEKDKPSIVSTGKRFYIVAGVFRNEANAQKMVAELQKKGFRSEKFGKIGELFGVSYDVFVSREDAEKALIRIKSETNPGAWIKSIEN